MLSFFLARIFKLLNSVHITTSVVKVSKYFGPETSSLGRLGLGTSRPRPSPDHPSFFSGKWPLLNRRLVYDKMTGEHCENGWKRRPKPWKNAHGMSPHMHMAYIYTSHMHMAWQAHHMHMACHSPHLHMAWHAPHMHGAGILIHF